MWNLTHKMLILLLCFTFSYDTFSQDPGHVGERVKTLKKIKLLEVLNLDEAASEKFLIKYTSWENKIEDKMAEMPKYIDDLESAIKAKKSSEELNKSVLLVQKAQSEMHSLMQERSKDMKSVLSDIQYAKYVLFEAKFRKELMKRLNKMKKQKDKNDLFD